MPLPSCVRIDASDMHSAVCLMDDGWREVEVLETWEREATPLEEFPCVPDALVREAREDDRPRCQWIASTSFTRDRLHADTKVNNATADLAKVQWVDHAFDGDADSILVIELEGDLVGFLVCQKINVAIIDLIAIDKRHRKLGLATQLIAAAILRYGVVMRAGTQCNNRAGQAVYEKLGFKPVRMQRTYHKN